MIDLVGYRRFGHNEQDEAAYTQPLMVERIDHQPTVRELYAGRLVEAGVIAGDEVDGIVGEVTATLRAAHDRLRASIAEPPAPPPEPPATTGTADVVETAVPAERLRALNEQLLQVPPGFTVNPKLARQLERRREAVEAGGIDWGQAEALAFASLLEDGIPIRLSGQDTERGTFSHRHLVLHDPGTGETATPIQGLPGANASFEVYNSPLSEYAALGFEYGYSVSAPDALVLWEAQFGDFVNGAQIVIDQFMVAGRSKWNQTSRLTLLLPHGYEGNGPEHSSARLERFLQQGAQDNIRVVQLHDGGPVLPPSAPPGARRRRPAARRHDAEGPAPAEAGVLDARGSLARARSRPCSTTRAPSHDDVERLVLCSGKLYYDIVGHDLHEEARTVAVARLEQLYPFPIEAVEALLGRYPRLREVVWAQEEPQNMGPWRSIRHRLEEAVRASSAESLRYLGRTWKASPSEGYPTAHQVEQDRIVRTALGVAS